MKTKRTNFNILARYAFVIITMLVCSGFIIQHMVDTTVINADKWNNKANTELSQIDTIYPERGDILACDGSVLATNMRFYTVRIDYTSGPFHEKQLKQQIDTVADSLARYFPVRNANEWKEKLIAPLKIANKKERPRSMKILENISYADYLKFRTLPFFNLPNKLHCGVILEPHDRRVNPYGKMARRSIGIVGETDSCKERHGRSGLEGALDSLLYGQIGFAKKIPLTRGITDWTDVPARRGYDITTTIDINMQELVETELSRGLEYCRADWGVAVLMDVKTGDIKAMANLEKDPNSENYIEAMNRAVMGYEPGSVVKTLSMIVALEDGIVSPDDRIETGAAWAYAGGRAIKDAHKVDNLLAREVLEYSSNIGMAKIITKKYGENPGSYYTRLKSLGILEPMHTGIRGEQKPRVDSVPSDRGGRIALSRMAYGYTTEFPPLYTLAIYNAIANGGKFVRPRLVSRVSGEGFDSIIPVSYIRDRICSERNAAIVRDMLTQVVWGDHGTARSLRSDLVRIAGKTGTCYIIEGKQYNESAKRLAFCGFFPAEDPVYSCIVLVSKPTQNAFGAAGTSGNILRSIAHKLYARGMLHNNSDYLAEVNENTYPTFYATSDTKRDASLRDAFNITGKHSGLKKSAASKSGVPDVRGLGLREATCALEQAGYNIDVEGSGFVIKQYPECGSNPPLGTKIMLTLSPQ